jgi:hypothetical protein
MGAWMAAAAVGTAVAATWTYPGCPNVDDTRDFGYDTLVIRGKGADAGLLEPVKVAVARDPAGDIEVYYAERNGKFKVFRAKSRPLTYCGNSRSTREMRTGCSGW